VPNDFEYADWLSMECLTLLESKRVVSSMFNTDYNKEFEKNFPIGDAVRVPYPQQFIGTRGLEYNPEAIARRHAHIEFVETFQIGFEWDNAEAVLRAPRGRERVSREILDPAMSQMAQNIDSFCAEYAANNAASLVGAIGTNPTSYDATSAAARQIMQELACPDTGDRAFIVPSKVMRSIKSANLGLFNPVTDQTKMFRKGIVGMADGFDWYESQSLKRHTTGVIATLATNTVTSTQTGTAAISTLVLTNTTGDTYKAGDKFNIAAVYPVHPQTRKTFGTDLKTFTITADVTSASSTATIAFSPAIYGPGSQYQNVDALPVAAAVVTMWPGTSMVAAAAKTGNIGLALHKNAFALVGKSLEGPKESSVELYSEKRDPDSGLYISFLRQFDGRSRKMINRFDCLLGVGTFFNDACAVAIACG